MQQATSSDILLIEANAALRRMITLGLQHHGLRVIEAESPARIPPTASNKPALVVLDIDGEVCCDATQLSKALEHPLLADVPVIVLAWETPVPAILHAGGYVTALAKPFDARALHAMIDDVLTNGSAQSPLSRQEECRASRLARPAPSIWPLVTAIGLLLMVIGLLLQVVVSALGLLVVLVALLLWTLGKKPEPDILLIELR